ncbi:hypothetical protein [Companilactobacillus mishanensis]|nr:hypothetical protein [Companilactobacillus mishanensis]
MRDNTTYDESKSPVSCTSKREIEVESDGSTHYRANKLFAVCPRCY